MMETQIIVILEKQKNYQFGCVLLITQNKDLSSLISTNLAVIWSLNYIQISNYLLFS